MVQRLTNIQVDRISLVDKGANGLRIALLKREAATRSARNIRKAPTLVPPSHLANVVAAAMAGVPGDPSITPDLRLDAVRTTAEAAGVSPAVTDQLLELVAKAIVGQARRADVAKRVANPFRGLM